MATEPTVVQPVVADSSVSDVSGDEGLESADAEMTEADLDEIAYQNAMRRIKEGKSPEPEEGDEEYEAPVEQKTKDEEEDLEEIVEEEEVKAKDAKKPNIKKFKSKSGEIEVDMNDGTEVERLIQKGVGANETFEEAALIRRNAESFVAALKENPFKILAHPSLGLDVRKAAEDYLWEQIQHEKLSPEEKAFKEREARLNAFEEAEEMKVKAEQTKREEAKRTKQREHWINVINKGLEKHGLPKNAWTLEETAKRMKVAIEGGDSDVTPDDVMPSIKSDWVAMFKSQIGSLDGDSLSNLFGKDVVTKINKSEIKKYRTGKFENKVATPEPKSDNRTYRTMEELQQSLRSKHR